MKYLIIEDDTSLYFKNYLSREEEFQGIVGNTIIIDIEEKQFLVEVVENNLVWQKIPEK